MLLLALSAGIVRDSGEDGMGDRGWSRRVAGATVVALGLAGTCLGDERVGGLGNSEEAQVSLDSDMNQPRPNMVGAYGPWLAEEVLGSGPGRLSFRTGRWDRVDEWRAVARERVLELLAPVDLGAAPTVTVESRHSADGLDFERLSWQLPSGPRTEAVFIKPAGAEGPLPGILGLHDHAGNKFLGWRKIVRTGKDDWEIQETHQSEYYAGLAWANEIARRGYAVLVHDTFPFASRRVRVKDVPEAIRNGGVDPEPDDQEGIRRYNAFAGAHEHIMAKSLFSAGTT